LLLNNILISVLRASQRSACQVYCHCLDVGKWMAQRVPKTIAVCKAFKEILQLLVVSTVRASHEGELAEGSWCLRRLTS